MINVEYALSFLFVRLVTKIIKFFLSYFMNDHVKLMCRNPSYGSFASRARFKLATQMIVHVFRAFAVVEQMIIFVPIISTETTLFAIRIEKSHGLVAEQARLLMCKLFKVA
jgi:hypothetical protein